MHEQCAFEVQYLGLPELAGRAESWWDDVLGVAHFSASPAGRSFGSVPVAEVLISPLGDAAGVCEVWRTPGPMRSGRVGAVHYRAGRHLLFGCVTVPEIAAPHRNGGDVPSPLRRATTQAYAGIFSVLDSLGYPHLMRVWNYLSDITADTAEGERYWQFNSARQLSFRARNRPVADNVPAASALGTRSGNPLVIYFLASPGAAKPIENPRQVSAFDYPARYGPHSPTFSRATLLDQHLGCPLLVSGTASIVGHETVHTDDVVAQTRESLTNISLVIDEANRVVGHRQYAPESLAYKVYVRHSGDLAAVTAEVHRAVGHAALVTYLQADVCRRDLLVEIEATGAGADRQRA